MPFKKSHLRKMPLELYLSLASFALFLDFSIAAIPILGFVVGLIFMFIVRWQLGFFDFARKNVFRMVMGYLATSGVELLSFGIVPSNFIYITVGFVINRYTLAQEKKGIKKKPYDNDNEPAEKKLHANDNDSASQEIAV